jgi:hypothetical protein
MERSSRVSGDSFTGVVAAAGWFLMIKITPITTATPAIISILGKRLSGFFLWVIADFSSFQASSLS